VAARPDEDWQRIVCIVPPEVEALWRQAIVRYVRSAGPLPTGATRAVSNGIVLEAVIADFLAGPEQPG
jgi:hypothetical protein